MDAQLLVVQKLEEKEGVLQSTLAALEKELALRTQALELNKRKVKLEGSQTPTSVLMSMTTMTQLSQQFSMYFQMCLMLVFLHDGSGGGGGPVGRGP